MKVFRKFSKILLGAFLAIAFAVSGSVATFAEDIPEYRIQMSPARNDIGDLKPGETYTGVFKVQNTGSKTFDFAAGVTPYYVVDENYSPDYESTGKYSDIVEWVKLSTDKGTVEPNGEVEVAYTITVPADVPEGGQYAMLYAEINPKDDAASGSGVAVSRRVGMLLYSNVQGRTRKTGAVLENKVPSFRFNPPVAATSVVENTGNTHTDATYVLQVYPLFGDEEVYTNEENPTKLTILPETRRFNTVTWPNAPHLGIFRVKQTVTIFDQTSTVEKVVFLCPIWFLFIIIALIFCAIFWIVTRIRARKQDRR